MKLFSPGTRSSLQVLVCSCFCVLLLPLSANADTREQHTRLKKPWTSKKYRQLPPVQTCDLDQAEAFCEKCGDDQRCYDKCLRAKNCGEPACDPCQDTSCERDDGMTNVEELCASEEADAYREGRGQDGYQEVPFSYQNTDEEPSPDFSSEIPEE